MNNNEYQEIINRLKATTVMVHVHSVLSEYGIQKIVVYPNDEYEIHCRDGVVSYGNDLKDIEFYLEEIKNNINLE